MRYFLREEEKTCLTIGSAPPDEFHKNDMFSVLKSVGSETRHSLKMLDVSPLAAPSCAPVFPSYGLSVPSAIRAAVSHTTPDTQLHLDSSLRAGLSARTPRLARLPRHVR